MTFKRFAPLLALLAVGCTASGTGSVTPGASALPSAGASAMPSAAASAMPSAAASTAASAKPSTAPSAAATAAPAAPGVDNLAAEACEHMAEGPMESKQANLVTMSRERAVVTAEHRRWDVQLVANAGKNEGYVLFENAEEGDFHFYLGADVPFKLKQDGKDVTFEATSKSGFGCDAVKASYAAELGIGQVELHFGPTDQKAVSLVLEKAEGEHDHAK